MLFNFLSNFAIIFVCFFFDVKCNHCVVLIDVNLLGVEVRVVDQEQ